MVQILGSLSTGNVTVADVPAPRPAPGKVLVRSAVSLISAGTERMLLDFGKANWLQKARQQPDKVRMVLDKVRTDGVLPTLEAMRSKLDQSLPLGYCNVGVVAELGANVSGFAVGDRVASNGPHAEFVSVPVNLCAKVPVSVSDEHAAFTVLGAIALQGIRLVQPSLGETVVVTGLGSIGLLTVQLLRAHGCRVLGIDFDPIRLDLARRFGADTVDLAGGQDPIEAARAFSRNRGVDAVLVTAATQSSEPVHQAAVMCRQRARIVLVGVAGLQLSREDFFKKELTFQVSSSYGPGRYDTAYEEKGLDYPFGFVRWTAQRNFEAVLDMMADGRLDPSLLISHRFAIGDASEAYALNSSGLPSLGVLLEYPGVAHSSAHRTVILPPISALSATAGTQSTAVSFVGAGNYATAVLIPAFKKAGATLRTVASNGGVTGLHAGRKFGFAQTTTDTAVIFDDPNTNTVVITTRHDSHARLVLQALASRKNVFVEKPLCLTLDQLAEIAALYLELSKSGQAPRIMVGFNRRFAPHVRKVKALLAGVTGPRSFVMTVNAGAIPNNHWTQDLEVGGGRVVGEGCHFIDLLRFLAGTPVVSWHATPMNAGTADTVTIQLSFADGSIGAVHYFANGSRSFPKERLEIFTAGRVLRLDNYRRLIGYGWPGFKSMSLWRQDKGQMACAAAFLKSVAEEPLRRFRSMRSSRCLESPSRPHLKKRTLGSRSMNSHFRHAFQETRELGLTRTVARLAWEFKVRSGFLTLNGAAKADRTPTARLDILPLPDPRAVREATAGCIPTGNMAALEKAASEAVRGRILCFSRWEADFGDPLDWHSDPISGGRWPQVHWSQAFRHCRTVGDVKLTWELGRFPHAYQMARAATFRPGLAPVLAAGLFRQIDDFRIHNPFGIGIHWQSSQEIAVRLWAWLFALTAFRALGYDGPDIGNDLYEGAVHVARHIEYARHAVYNNHLLSEAFCLYLVGTLLPDVAEAPGWRTLGSTLLAEQAGLQIYPDGGYIQNSHNYHRFAMQIYLLASMFERQHGKAPREWGAAMERSLDFLHSHQNPEDGRLPNYGANDGALPLILSTCDYSDFRPTLQALSIATRNERIYPPGPWDEEAAWLLGPESLQAPLKNTKRRSVSFSHSGYHVLRGSDSGNFGAFRCGNILDRFSQIDMLHLDVWWRGHNVLADPGSFLYNGPEEWHDHFLGTGSHNTVQVDARDQMLHYRKFKCLYWTKAKLLRFEDNADWSLCEGEHYGFQRHPGRCVHRRSVMFLKDDVWIVVDRIQGSGAHRVRLHWLGGNFPYRSGVDGQASFELETPDGSFFIAVFDGSGKPLSGDVIAGQSDPPRGWISRYYGEKVPVPSLAVEVSERLPLTMVSILGAHVPSVSVTASTWSVTAGDRVVEFELNADGISRPRSLTTTAVPA